MAALARERIRLWAAFSRWDFSRAAVMSRMITRMTSTPITRISTVPMSFLKNRLPDRKASSVSNIEFLLLGLLYEFLIKRLKAFY